MRIAVAKNWLGHPLALAWGALPAGWRWLVIAGVASVELVVSAAMLPRLFPKTTSRAVCSVAEFLEARNK